MPLETDRDNFSRLQPFSSAEKDIKNWEANTSAWNFNKTKMSYHGFSPLSNNTVQGYYDDQITW